MSDLELKVHSWQREPVYVANDFCCIVIFRGKAPTGRSDKGKLRAYFERGWKRFDYIIRVCPNSSFTV